MRKLKSFKGINRRKSATVELSDGIELPIRTLSISEEVMYSIDSFVPMKFIDRRATQEEIDEMKAKDPNFNTKLVTMIRTFDTTNKEYLSKVQEIESLRTIMEVVKFIDMDYILENGSTLWEEMSLTKNDWVGACRYFAHELCVTSKDLETIINEIRALRGESVFEKLSRFEKLSNKSVIKILEYVSAGMEREEALGDFQRLMPDKKLEADDSIMEANEPLEGIEEKPKKTTAKTKKVNKK